MLVYVRRKPGTCGWTGSSSFTNCQNSPFQRRSDGNGSDSKNAANKKERDDCNQSSPKRETHSSSITISKSILDDNASIIRSFKTFRLRRAEIQAAMDRRKAVVNRLLYPDTIHRKTSDSLSKGENMVMEDDRSLQREGNDVHTIDCNLEDETASQQSQIEEPYAWVPTEWLERFIAGESLTGASGECRRKQKTMTGINLEQDMTSSAIGKGTSEEKEGGTKIHGRFMTNDNSNNNVGGKGTNKRDNGDSIVIDISGEENGTNAGETVKITKLQSKTNKTMEAVESDKNDIVAIDETRAPNKEERISRRQEDMIPNNHSCEQNEYLNCPIYCEPPHLVSEGYTCHHTLGLRPGSSLDHSISLSTDRVFKTSTSRVCSLNGLSFARRLLREERETKDRVVGKRTVQSERKGDGMRDNTERKEQKKNIEEDEEEEGGGGGGRGRGNNEREKVEREKIRVRSVTIDPLIARLKMKRLPQWILAEMLSAADRERYIWKHRQISTLSDRDPPLPSVSPNIASNSNRDGSIQTTQKSNLFFYRPELSLPDALALSDDEIPMRVDTEEERNKEKEERIAEREREEGKEREREGVEKKKNEKEEKEKEGEEGGEGDEQWMDLTTDIDSFRSTSQKEQIVPHTTVNQHMSSSTTRIINCSSLYYCPFCVEERYASRRAWNTLADEAMSLKMALKEALKNPINTERRRKQGRETRAPRTRAKRLRGKSGNGLDRKNGMKERRTEEKSGIEKEVEKENNHGRIEDDSILDESPTFYISKRFLIEFGKAADKLSKRATAVQVYTHTHTHTHTHIYIYIYIYIPNTQT